MRQELKIVLLVAAAFTTGIVVLIANPQYRVNHNLESNQNYYPSADNSLVTLTSHKPPPHTPPPLPQSDDSDIETAYETDVNDMIQDLFHEPFPDIDF